MTIVYIAAVALIIYGMIGVFKNLKNDHGSDTGTLIISFLIPLVGFIIYGVNNDKQPAKAKAALTAALCGVGLGLIWYLLARS